MLTKDSRATKRQNEMARQFNKFHQENPEVYARLAALARRLKKHNTVAGIGTLWEVLRHDYLLQGLDAPKGLPNNHRSRYARLLMLQEPDLKGFFALSKLRA
jgi:hypothetical protein